MKFNIGDFVAVIDDVVKGKVTKIDGDIVYITDETEMEFFYSYSELVLIKENQKELTKYNDINNELLKDKIQRESQQKKTVYKKSKKRSNL